MNPSPNLPKKEKEHLPAWGNMELQNYDTASATGTSGGLEIKSTVRGLTEEDLKTGADYLVFVQSHTKVAIQWNNEWHTGSYAADTAAEMGFPTGCENPEQCKKLFVQIGCIGGDLARCRLAFVWQSWTDSNVLSVVTDKPDDETTITDTELFTGTLSDDATWELSQSQAGSWTIKNKGGRYLSSRPNPGAPQYNQLKSVAEVSPAATWGISGIFSARIFAKADLTLPYNVTGKIRVPGGQGTWPTFWLLPSTQQMGKFWPLSGEIDIFDHVANNGQEMRNVVHVKDFHSGGASGPKKVLNNVSGNTDRFVEYSLVATAERLVFSIDGTQTMVYDNAGSTAGENYPFDAPFHLVINLAVGGIWGAEKGVDFTLSDATIAVSEVTVCTADGRVLFEDDSHANRLLGGMRNTTEPNPESHREQRRP